MIDVEEIDRRGVLAFNEANLQLPHEPGRRHPEIIAHHDDALHPSAVALPQGLNQFRILFFLLGVQPLLELVEDDQHLLAGRNALPPAQCGQSIFQAEIVRQGGTPFAQAVQQPGLGILGRRFEVDGDHVVGQPGQQARLHQRRFATAALARRSGPR